MSYTATGVKSKEPFAILAKDFLAFPAGVEPTTFRLGGGRSILLSYGNKFGNRLNCSTETGFVKRMGGARRRGGRGAATKCLSLPKILFRRDVGRRVCIGYSVRNIKRRYRNRHLFGKPNLSCRGLSGGDRMRSRDGGALCESGRDQNEVLLRRGNNPQ